MIPRITFLLVWVHDTLNYTLYKMFLTQRENFLSLPVPIKKINSPVKLQESFNKTRNFSAFSVLTSMLEAAAADLLVAGSIISNFCGFVLCGAAGGNNPESSSFHIIHISTKIIIGNVCSTYFQFMEQFIDFI